MCNERAAILAIDNTFMSPVLQNPLALGADVVLHSCTKYIGGHCDVLAGAICVNDESLYDKFWYNMKNLGTCLSPFDSYMCLKGAKTMKLRVM